MYPDVLLFIDGVWTPAMAERTLPVVNLASGDVVATVANADRPDLDRALEALTGPSRPGARYQPSTGQR